MPSLPAFALGCASGLYLVTAARLDLWRKDTQLTHEYLASTPTGRQPSDRHLFFGPAVRRWIVTQWNVGVVDRIAKPLIADLADRGW
jgi:hypothetical protein